MKNKKKLQDGLRKLYSELELTNKFGVTDFVLADFTIEILEALDIATKELEYRTSEFTSRAIKAFENIEHAL